MNDQSSRKTNRSLRYQGRNKQKSVTDKRQCRELKSNSSDPTAQLSITASEKRSNDDNDGGLKMSLGTGVSIPLEPNASVGSRRRTLDEVFGKFHELPRVGRQSALSSIWRKIIEWSMTFNEIVTKRPAWYVHGSPGMGKTYILRELFKKKSTDIPSELRKHSSSIDFIVFDFNRNACVQNSENFNKNNIELFLIARLYYVNCVDQSAIRWGGYVRNIVIAAINNGTEAVDELINDLRNAIKKSCPVECKCRIALVDEISKLDQLGEGTAEYCRSLICAWLDEGDIFNGVLFSSLSVHFMKKECSSSGRPVQAIATLPLLSYSDSVTLIRKSLDGVCKFVDDQHREADFESGVNQLAVVCGGHPRSIEYIIKHCNGSSRLSSFSSSIDLASIIHNASAELTCSYTDVENWDLLFNAVILAEPVNKHDRLDPDNEESETFESLVTRGVLVDSFGDDGNKMFVPATPELFLHQWVVNIASKGERDQIEQKRLLQQILDLRSCFTRIQFENLHANWEELSRYSRNHERYRRITILDLYKIEMNSNVSNIRIMDPHDLQQLRYIVRCSVDASVLLTAVPYMKDTKLSLSPNCIYNPLDATNKGWDRLIGIEAFPSENQTESRFIIPVFIQNKFSSNNSTTKLSLDTVMKAHTNCAEFTKNKIKLFKGFEMISKESLTSPSDKFDNNFILIFIAKCNKYSNTVEGAPSNVLFCFGDDLKRLYGPSLAGFVDYLVPDSVLCVASSSTAR